MYKLKKDLSINDILTKGKEFSKNNDRLGFAKFTENCATWDCSSSSTIDNIYNIYVKVGKDFKCKPGTILGGYGFGFERDENGVPHHLYHFGKVIIGNNVWIGSNCTVDRGNIDDTIIGDNTKIDNMVHIAHNCKIGKNVIICAGVTFCGSVTIKDNVWLAPGTVIREGITIGEGAKTGLGAVVVKDVPPHTLVMGVPAKIKVQN